MDLEPITDRRGKNGIRAIIVAALAAVIGATPAAHAAANAPASLPPVVAPRLTPNSSMPPAELEAFVDGVVREAMRRDHIAGVAVSVVQNGQVLLDRGYGFAGPGRLVDPDATLFRIGSISKTFTWIAAMKEVDAGRMRLDAPINSYLPSNVAVPNAPDWRQVELRDLMSHTPGFEDRPLNHLFVWTPDQIWPLVTQLRLTRPRRVFAPGTTPAYSNYGAMLAGEAVANPEHETYEDVVEREIIDPLGLNHTTFREPYPPRPDLPPPMSPALAADVATGYRWTGTEFAPQSFEWVTQAAPAGAGSSTAEDMGRYMLMMLDGGDLDGVRIYSPATALAFRTPIHVPEPDGGDVCHGFFETQLPGGFLGYGHGGDTSWFHSNLITVPQLGLGIFVTTNTDTGPRLVDELPALVVGHFYATPQDTPRAGAPALVTERNVYAGTYLTNRRPFTGLERFVYLLIGEAHVRVAHDGRLISSDDGGTRAWTPIGPPGHFQAVEGPQTTDFVIRGGEAVRWYPPGGASSFDRVGPLYQLSVLKVVAALGVIAALAALIGPAIRFRRELPLTTAQFYGNGVQLFAAAAWLFSFGSLAVFAAGAANQAQVLFNWPGPALLTGSTVALVASAASLIGLLLLPFIWAGRSGWTIWRKLRFSASALIFAALGCQLGFWGLLQPWAT